MNYALSPKAQLNDQAIAQGIGWTSIAIGLSELLLTRRIEQALGLRRDKRHTALLQTLGVRELFSGFDILSHRNPGPGMWARVVGDVLDVALLGVAARKTRNPAGFSTVVAMVLGVGVLDLLFAQRLSHRR